MSNAHTHEPPFSPANAIDAFFKGLISHAANQAVTNEDAEWMKSKAMTKMCFDQYATNWYLIPADMRDQFTEDGYKVTCAEDEFMEDGGETAAVAWSSARREFRDKYDQYKIKHHISSYVFENPYCDWGDDNKGAAMIVEGATL